MLMNILNVAGHCSAHHKDKPWRCDHGLQCMQTSRHAAMRQLTSFVSTDFAAWVSNEQHMSAFELSNMAHMVAL